ncbi:MAG: hypothetical protein J6K17_04765 [Oscillospiraceae bacterium]|nr:hypothetical protein [Oscillospiraceae bacterium]
MHKRIYAAVIASALLLTGCSENETSEEGYKIFSNGTYIVQQEEPVDGGEEYDYADFYIPNGMVNDYYSSSFSDEEKELYNSILEVLGGLEDKTPLKTDAAVYEKMLKTIRVENLAFPHITKYWTEYNGGEFEVAITYRMTADEISSMNMAAEKAAKKIIDSLDPDMDDYEKLKYFHDYLILNCETDKSYAFSDTVYGALVENKALCEGYSKAFAYLCNLAGIENTIVTGETYVPHMWNMVKLDGNWYHVDVTWDKPDDQLHKMFPDIILYQYFMVTDAVIENTHIIDGAPYIPPQAFGTAENYFEREGADISSKEELLTVSENAILSAVKTGKPSAMVKFETTDVFISCKNDLSNEELFDSIIEKANLEYGKNIKLSWTDFYGQYRILTFVIEYIE